MGTQRLDRSAVSDREQQQARSGANPRTAPRAVARAAGAIGNRAMAQLIQRQPATASQAGATKTLPITSFAPTKDEVAAAEAWVLYIAQRGLVARPSAPLPDRYQPGLDNLNNAVWGAHDDGRRKPAAEARSFLRTLRELHEQLLKGQDTRALDLAELALQRAIINVSHAEGELAFADSGATQLDVGQTLLVLQTRADDELAAAKEMGYIIPEDLARLGAAAHARYEAASKTWVRGAPSSEKVITPADEADLVKFRDQALAITGSMHAKRAADLARFHQAEADALQAAAEKNLTELRAMLADRRRALFMAGARGDLDKLHEATGDIVGVVNEMKSAAAIITSRVDQLNSIAQALTQSKSKLINLPDLPKGLTDAFGKVKTAHEKLGKIIEILGVLGPGKTQLDDGLKYLKGLDMSLDEFGSKAAKGNPFISVYVNSYLRPGIQNCIAQLGKIAGIISAENKSIIQSGDPRMLIAVNWAVEPGGEAVYRFLAQVFKVGGMAQIDAAAWEYFKDHADDLGAAVGEALPGDMRTVGAWAARNKYALWETFYGSTRPPR